MQLAAVLACLHTSSTCKGMGVLTCYAHAAGSCLSSSGPSTCASACKGAFLLGNSALIGHSRRSSYSCYGPSAGLSACSRLYQRMRLYAQTVTGNV